MATVIPTKMSFPRTRAGGMAGHQDNPQKAGIEKGGAVMQRMLGYLRDERGIETLEWIAIGALILGIAFVVYPGTLQPALTTLVGTISTALGTIALP